MQTHCRLHLPFILTLCFIHLAISGDFISEIAVKAAAAKRLEKVQREAALEAVKMAKRQRGFYQIHILILFFAG